MLGLVLIYFVGKAFYELAFEYNKSKWGFAIAGVVSYYATLYASGIIIATIVEINSPGYITESNQLVFGLVGIPFGILGCWAFYTILKNNWRKQKSESQPDTLDGSMIDNSNRYGGNS